MHTLKDVLQQLFQDIGFSTPVPDSLDVILLQLCKKERMSLHPILVSHYPFKRRPFTPFRILCLPIWVGFNKMRMLTNPFIIPHSWTQVIDHIAWFAASAKMNVSNHQESAPIFGRNKSNASQNGKDCRNLHSVFIYGLWICCLLLVASFIQEHETSVHSELVPTIRHHADVLACTDISEPLDLYRP